MTNPAASLQASVMGAAEPAGAEPGTFRALVTRELDYVWASLRRLGVAERDIEDVAQELFLEVHRRLADYDPGRPMRPWLFAFCFRFASDYRRLARHRLVLSGEPLALDPPASAPGAEESLVDRDRRALVAEALDALDLDRRAVLVAHELDGVPVAEIAAALGIPLFTVYSRLRTAREEFAGAVRRIQLRRGAR